MADEADLGNESAEMHLRLALGRCLDDIEDYGGSEVCIECGEEIPAARRVAVPGCKRCLRCQVDFERRNRCNINN
jgi:phage/conjugal plasmid C-4 type zinc finger TraR family protein